MGDKQSAINSYLAIMNKEKVPITPRQPMQMKTTSSDMLSTTKYNIRYQPIYEINCHYIWGLNHWRTIKIETIAISHDWLHQLGMQARFQVMMFCFLLGNESLILCTLLLLNEFHLIISTPTHDRKSNKPNSTIMCGVSAEKQLYIIAGK